MEQIIFISQDTENTLLYMDEGCHKIGCSSVRKWAEKATGEKVNDCFYIKQDELQYYCIDGRLHVTPQDEDKILEYIKK